jgi:hypothetical protein
MARVAAVLPGYASVARAAEVLHLAPRSVRDLIYAGRLPSSRIGRLHYVRTSDLELERRRRLGLRLPAQRPRVARARLTAGAAAPRRARVDPEVRKQRAAQRAADVSRWAERHPLVSTPQVPFAAGIAAEDGQCAICGRGLRAGARVVHSEAEQLCLTCGRRALLDWADRRRQDATAARRIAQDLGAPAEPHRVA